MIEFDEADQQLIVRALALQSLQSPGFEAACRLIAVKLQGEQMFDEFMRLMADLFPHFAPRRPLFGVRH